MNNPSSALPFVIVDGNRTDVISVFERAFQYGDGLFETIAIRSGKPALLNLHLNRLNKGLETLGIASVDLHQLQTDILRYANQFDDAVLKLVISRGQSQRGYKVPDNIKPTIVYSLSEKSYPASLADIQPVRVKLCQTPVSINPVLAGLKHLNRLEQVLARNEWHDPDITEGLMCDTDGNVIEATAANLFIVKDNILYTPDLTRSGVAGTARQVVIAAAQQIALPCEIKQLGVEECMKADAMFLTNCLVGVLPVKQFESVRYDTDKWPTKLLDKVMQDVFS